MKKYEEQQKKLEELQKKRDHLVKIVTQINTKIEAAQENKAKTEKDLLETYGTSDIKELESLLEKWSNENEAELTKMEKALNELEQEALEKEALIKKIQQEAI